MQIELKETDMCKFDVKYIADAGEILNKRGDVLKLFKNAPVKGFRKGKAPISTIKSKPEYWKISLMWRVTPTKRSLPPLAINLF